jgi:hypothetical protein
MKFTNKINFAKLYVALIFATCFFSLCENRLRKNKLRAKHILTAQAGELCYQSLPGFQARRCPDGYECRAKDGEEDMPGNELICREKIEKASLTAQAGELCYQALPNFQARRCPDGYECRAKDGQEDMPGNELICREKILTAQAGELCYQSLPNFQARRCPDGYECRVRDGQEHMTGQKLICQLAIEKASLTAQAGELCYQALPNFQARRCPDGYECRAKDGEEHMKGNELICREKILTAQAGELCYQSLPNFQARRCPDGYECRAKDGEEHMDGNKLICREVVAHQ